MYWIKLLVNKIWKNGRNKYLLSGLLFLLWMLFFDTNSWLAHRSLDQKIEQLEETRTFYQEEMEKDSLVLEIIDEDLERYAREEHLLSRPNEQIYLLNDSIDE